MRTKVDFQIRGQSLYLFDRIIDDNGFFKELLVSRNEPIARRARRRRGIPNVGARPGDQNGRCTQIEACGRQVVEGSQEGRDNDRSDDVLLAKANDAPEPYERSYTLGLRVRVGWTVCFLV